MIWRNLESSFNQEDIETIAMIKFMQSTFMVMITMIQLSHFLFKSDIIHQYYIFFYLYIEHQNH